MVYPPENVGVATIMLQMRGLNRGVSSQAAQGIIRELNGYTEM